MIDLSGLPEDECFEYMVDFAIRHAIDDIQEYVSVIDIDQKVIVANDLLSILAYFI